MEPWLIWVISGGTLIGLELLVPGGITIFVGLAAMIVGALIKFGVLIDPLDVAMTFLILSVILLLFLRTIFLRYFEGSSRKQNINEDLDAMGSIVLVMEDIHPYKEGRINFRGAGWQARSEEEIQKGSKAVISGRDGNTWIVKSI